MDMVTYAALQKQMREAGTGTGSTADEKEVFIVPFSLGQTGFVLDRVTYDDINTEYNKGKRIIGKGYVPGAAIGLNVSGTFELPLSYFAENGSFVLTLLSGQITCEVWINSDNTITSSVTKLLSSEDTIAVGESDVFHFSIDDLVDCDYISCTFDELKTACQDNKILIFHHRDAPCSGRADSVSDSKITINGIDYAYSSYLSYIRISVTPDGKVQREELDHIATNQTVRDLVQEELSYAGSGTIHFGCFMSNDFVVNEADGISISDLFDAVGNWIHVRACMQCAANPVLDQAFIGTIHATEMRYDQNNGICVFSFRYKGRSFELTVHRDETIEFAEVTNTTT